MNCTNITSNIVAAECSKQAISGTGRKVVLLNYDDVDRTKSTVVENVITAIVLKQGKNGVTFTTHGDSTLGETSLKKGTYINSFVHNATLRIFSKEEANKKFVNTLAGAKVIAIIENNEGGAAGAVKHEAYGWDSGLELHEIASTTEFQDGIVYGLKLGTNEKSTENSLPKSYFNTDLATTETALAALVTV